MAKISLQQSERAEEAEDYSVAIALAGEARLLAARAGDLTLKKDAEDRLRALKPARAAYENALDSHRKLSKNPQDAAAHLALGKYHAFVRRAWTKGLDLMAKGGDSSLQSLARQDLASPKDPGIQFDLAEAWLACAEKSVDRLEKNAARDRARYWGERASPGLTGERGRKLQARLDALITGDLPGSHVDLLALIDLRKDVVHGEWAVENGSLVCRKSSPSARVQIPYLPPDEYEVEVVLTRLEGKEAANIGLARGESQFHVVIDGWPEDGFRSGLSMVDGKLADQNPTTRKGLLLTNGKASTVRCRVTKEGVSATLDGQPFFEWKGEFSRLSPFHILKVPNPKALSLVSYDCQFQFIKAVLTPVSGEGRRLR